MSTRCIVFVKDEYSHLLFYRHSDGYPSATGESLKTFLRWLIEGRIRDNASQASGWLVLLGAAEYDKWYDAAKRQWIDKEDLSTPLPASSGASIGWKCGAYEPCSEVPGDIEYVYVVDLQARTIACHRPTMVPVAGKGYSDATFDVKSPPKPFYVVNAQNIDAPIVEPDPEK